MITCSINGQTAYPDTAQKIKVTYANQYVEDSGSYTYEVQFPMAILANKRIFSNVDRFDVVKSLDDFDDCRLLADNRLVISGKGTVTSITDTTVKLQIIGGKSRIKYDAKLDTHYIDDMDFPDVVITKGIDRDGYSKLGLSQVTLDKDATFLMVDFTDWHFVGQPGVCAFNPIEDETNNTTANQLYIVNWDKLKVNGVSWPTGTKRVYMSRLAVQPYLMYVIKTVIENEGYTLLSNDFDTEPWNRLIIANATRTVRIKDALPHWTVYKLLDEVRKLFNASILFDEAKRTVSIVAQNELLNNGNSSYTCSDEFTSEYDEDGLKNLATSNIEYAFDNAVNRSWRETISQSVFKNYETKTYDTTVAMQTAAKAMSKRERLTTIFKVGSTYYVFANEDYFGNETEDENSLVVGFFNPYIRDMDSDEYTDLAICPAATYLRKRLLDNEKNGIFKYLDGFGFSGYIPLPSAENTKQATLEEMTSDDDGEYYYSVKDAMQGSESSETEEADESSMPVMFQGRRLFNIDSMKLVAYDKKLSGEDTQKRYPVTFTDYRNFPAWNGENGTSLSLEALPAKAVGGTFGGGRGGSTGTTTRYDNGATVDKHHQTKITFFTDSIPDPALIYIFHNKRYICGKIEIEVTNEGVSREKTGYFYEIVG